MTQIPTTSQTQSVPRPGPEQTSSGQIERGASEKFSEAVRQRKPGADETGKGEAARGKGENLSAVPESPFSMLGRLPGQGKREPGERGDGKTPDGPGQPEGSADKSGKALPAGDKPGQLLSAGDKAGNIPSGEDGPGKKTEAEVGKGAMPGAEALLAALGGQPARGPEGAAAPRELDPVLANRLVDRILVSAPDAGGPAEVRISLRDDVLPGTEVRIQRLADGGVRVQFVTENPQAERMLGQSQLNGLQQTLGESLRAEVRVSTIRTDGSLSSEADGGNADGGRREQGGGQEGDSRRRSSQYDLYRDDTA